MKRFILIFLLIFIIGLTFWLINSIDEIHLSNHRSENPDAFITDATIIKTDKTGIPNMQLTAPKLNLFKKSNITKMISPKISVKNAAATWEITAQKGTAYSHPQYIVFENNVIIHKQAKSEKPMMIKTSQITIYPQKSTAKTDRAVTILQANNIIQGKGLIAHLKTGDAQILSDIHQNYKTKKGSEGENPLGTKFNLSV